MERPSEIELTLRTWEGNVKELVIPLDSQAGRTWDLWTTVQDYTGFLHTRTRMKILFDAASKQDRTRYEHRLCEADAVFIAKTEPDDGGLLQRAGATLDFEPDGPGDEPMTEPWLTRVPTRGVFRRALEHEAAERDKTRPRSGAE